MCELWTRQWAGASVDEVKAHGSGSEAASADQAATILVMRAVRELLPRGKRRLGVELLEAVRERRFFEGGKEQNLRAVRQDWRVGYKGLRRIGERAR
jgi:hypothetical protein